MFDARISEVSSGIGLTRRRSDTTKMIGVISTTVVTLSMSADTTAVMIEMSTSRRYASPAVRSTASAASHSNKPVFARMLAMTIIPTSRKMTFQSTTASENASCCVIRPSASTATAPTSAATVRCTRSEMMRT